jgi:hypothetical protein
LTTSTSYWKAGAIRFCRYADDSNIYVRSLAAGAARDGIGDTVSGREAQTPGEP